MEEIFCRNCGLVGDYHTVMKSGQNTAWCNGCSRFIKNISQGKPPTIFFGKYKGTLVSEMQDVSYLEWLIKANVASPKLIDPIKDRISELKFQGK